METMTSHGALQWKNNVDRLYIKRKEEAEI